MALMDRPEDNPENLSEKEIKEKIAQQRESWELREKNYLAEMTMMEQVNYQAFKRKVQTVRREQVVILLEEYYLYNKRQESMIKTLAKKNMENM